MDEHNQSKQSNGNIAALLLFHLIFFLIVLINFPLNKWFIGWDSISPELNFSLNAQRAATAVWQENYGLGTMTGHGFAATLPHTAITWLFSFVLPEYMIRSAFTFFCLYLGGLGMFFLSTKLLSTTLAHKKTIRELTPHIALISSLWYILNIGTVQIFYVQLEAFIAQFAALPWLFFTLISFIDTRKKKWLFAFFIVNVVASIQGFIPSLFVSYVLVLVFFLLSFTLKTKRIKTAFGIVLIVAAANLYWFLPVLAHQYTQGSDFLRAYNNITSTQDFIAKNQKYGTLGNVMLLKSFYLDTKDGGKLAFDSLISHYKNPVVLITAYAFAALALLGIYWTTRRIYLKKTDNNDFLLYFALGFSVLFVLLATGMPVVSHITGLMQEIVPTFKQAFRSTFTKFGVVFIFHFCLFLTLGLAIVLDALFRKVKNSTIAIGFFFAVLIGIGAISLPIFQGNLLYKKLLVTVPQNYKQIIQFFNSQPNGRIADFPQGCPEGWYGYNWGYFGSGFYWYGIKQPIMSRTFDVWSNKNENYYWQLSQILNRHDYQGFDKLMNRYDVTWILYDPNFLHCRSSKAFYEQFELAKHLDDSPLYKLEGEYDAPETRPIRIYRYIGKTPTNNYVNSYTNLPNIGPGFAYTDLVLGVDAYKTNGQSTYDVYYPFSNVFTKRSALLQKNSGLSIDSENITIQSIIPSNLIGHTLQLPAYADNQKIVPVRLSIEKQNNANNQINIELLLPKIMLDGVAITNTDNSKRTLQTEFTDEQIQDSEWYVNGEKIEKVGDTKKFEFYFSTENDNRIEIFAKDGTSILSWNTNQDGWYKQLITQTQTIVLTNYGNGKLTVTMPKIFDGKSYGITRFAEEILQFTPKPCNSDEKYVSNYQLGIEKGAELIQLVSKNSRDCLTIPLDATDTDSAYILELRAQTIKGEKPTMRVLDKNAQIHIQTPLATTQRMQTYYHIMPAGTPFDKGYTFEFENKSFSGNESISNFGGLAMWHVPLEFLQHIVLEKGNMPKTTATAVDAKRINETLYTGQIDTNALDNTTLVLNQGFHPGWLAFSLNGGNGENGFKSVLAPFFGGRLITKHVLVNGWANGWDVGQSCDDLQSTCNFVLIFWPQYLLYVGYGILVVTFIRLLVQLKS